LSEGFCFRHLKSASSPEGSSRAFTRFVMRDPQFQGCGAEGSCLIRAKGRRGKIAAGNITRHSWGSGVSMLLRLHTQLCHYCFVLMLSLFWIPPTSLKPKKLSTLNLLPPCTQLPQLPSDLSSSRRSCARASLPLTWQSSRTHSLRA
jgi:hypothetical protein